jgi:hypothetical protein
MRACGAVLFVAVVAGCGSADADRAPGPADVPRVELVETLRIGSVDDPDQSLTRVGGVLPRPDGTVWITQPDDAEFRIHGGDGALASVGGGRGQGPGEFTVPGVIGAWGAAGDSVWIADPFLRRVSIFDAAGTFARSFPLPSVELDDGSTVSQPRTFTRDGAAIGVASAGGGGGPGGLPIVRYDPLAPEAATQIGTLERGTSVTIRWQGADLATGAHPLSDAPLVATHPDGRVIVVERDVAAAPFVRLITVAADGDTVWSREYAYEPQEVPRAEADSIYDGGIRSFTQFTRLDGQLSDDDAAAAYRASVTIPAVRPPVRSLHVGADGRIWLEWAAAPGAPAAWWILTREGEPVAAFEASADMTVRAVDGDALWAVETDDLDVPYVVRYEIRP